MTYSPKRLLCWFGRHDWRFKIAYVEPPDYDAPFGMHRGATHYTGLCLRCGDRDLFSGPYRAEFDDHSLISRADSPSENK